uniref:Tick transposon n=1 Tax=Rhipicephalus appendiculatus TaxID=34631 RepID=A0A131YJM3_RHIAP
MLRTPPRGADPSPSHEEDDTKDNPVLRTSRRQQGLQPEHGLLPENTRPTKRLTSTAGTMTTPVPPATIVIQPPREPPTFHGSPREDPPRPRAAMTQRLFLRSWRLRRPPPVVCWGGRWGTTVPSPTGPSSSLESPTSLPSSFGGTNTTAAMHTSWKIAPRKRP